MYRYDNALPVWKEIQIIAGYRESEDRLVYSFVYPMSDGYASFRLPEEQRPHFGYLENSGVSPVVSGFRVYHFHGWILPVPLTEEQRARVICDLLSFGVCPTFWEGE